MCSPVFLISILVEFAMMNVEPYIHDKLSVVMFGFSDVELKRLSSLVMFPDDLLLQAGYEVNEEIGGI